MSEAGRRGDPRIGPLFEVEQLKMSMQTQTALPSRALRRNRLVLGAIAATILPAAGLATGAFVMTGSHPGPLLLNVGQVPVIASELANVRFSPVVSHDATLLLNLPYGQGPNTPAIQSSAALNVHDVCEDLEELPRIEVADAPADADVRWFNGRPVRPVRTMKMLVTAYSPDSRSCGDSDDGITASGYSVWTNAMKMVAADTRLLPFGSMISVPGYDSGEVVPVLDRGGAIKGHHLDLLYPTHEQALNWGAQDLEITVWEYADGKPNDFVCRYNADSSVNPPQSTTSSS